MVDAAGTVVAPLPPAARGDGPGSGLLNDTVSPSYSLIFARNGELPYSPVPVVLGRHRVVPPLAGKTIQEVDDADGAVYQKIIVVWGYGPLHVSDIRIGISPIADYDDIEIETRDGRSNDAALTLYDHSIAMPVPVALSAIRVRITDQLPRNVTEISGTVESECLDWDGAAWAAARTSNPASLMRWVLQHPARRNAAADADVDLSALQDFHEFCEANGYEFNAIHDIRRSVWDLVSDVCAVARAAPTLTPGIWSVVVDDGSQEIADHLTPVNTDGFGIDKSFAAAPHAMRVRFPNRNKGWRRDERIVYRDTYDDTNATNISTVSPAGITDPAHVWKFARYRLALLAASERWTAQISLENLLISRGQKVSCQFDELAAGVASARVEAVNTNARGQITSVDIDVPIHFAHTESYSAKFRTATDADLVVALDLAGGPDTDPISRLVFDAASNEVIEPGDLVSVGLTGEVQLEALVVRVERRRDLEANVLLTPYRSSVYDAETGAIPDFASVLSDLEEPLPPMVISDVRSGLASAQRIGNVLEPRIVVDVNRIPVAGVRMEAQIRESNESDWEPADIRSQDSSGLICASVQAGTSYQVRCRWVLPEENRVGDWDRVSHTVETIQPDPVTDFSIEVVAGGSRAYSFRPPADRDLAGVRIRYSSDDADEWGNMTDLHEGLLTASPLYSYEPVGGTYSFEARAVSADDVESDGVRISNVNLAAVRSLGRFKELTAYRKQGVTDMAPERPGFTAESDALDWGSYDFSDGDFTPPTGWVEDWPEHDADEVVYAITATAVDTGGDAWDAGAGAWSDPGIISDSGDINIIYRRLTSAGRAPGSSEVIPDDWYDSVEDVPAGSGHIHVSVGLRRRGTTLFVWQKPEQLEGSAGIDGTVWRFGAGAPSSSLGVDGDFYLRTDTGEVYQKDGGSWSKEAELAGADGATWFNGTTEPASNLGVDGDYYFRTGTATTAAEIWRKESGTWRKQIDINEGSDGEDGEDGSAWHAGAGVPSESLGGIGDWYFRTDNGFVYEKTP